jgi:signal transduction histidine kinase
VRRLWRDRLGLLNWRSSIVSAALAGMVIVSAAGAWSVRTSWLAHQRAVEVTLDEYAAYAARSFVQHLASENEVLRTRAMAAVLGASAFPEHGLALDGFARSVAAALDTRVALADDPLRGFFRIDLATGRYEGAGAAAGPDAERVIAATAHQQRAVLDTALLPLPVRLPVAGDRASTYFAYQRGVDGRPVAIYGFTISWKRSFTPFIAGIIPRTRLLPPSVLDGGGIDAGRLDTLVALRVVEPDGSILYASPRQFTSSASAVLRRGGMTPLDIHATLHPALVARLRAELLDDSRRRLQLALPILSVLLAVAAILHFRRERELVRARRDFVASVSHELRTPLAQIRMFSETLLLRREDGEEERMRWIGVIGREARRLGDLVENILLFSHIDAARVRIEPERTDLGELVEEVVEAYVPIAEARRMRIVADAPSRIMAVVDPRAIRQVVVNLVDNALKYGPSGQTVSVEVERDGAVARLTVSDQGPGVPRADRTRLWRPFVRLGAEGSTAGGSGIGLSVVRSLVRQHGGEVAVHDAAGGGARFVVTLPCSGATGAFPVVRAAVL